MAHMKVQEDFEMQQSIRPDQNIIEQLKGDSKSAMIKEATVEEEAADESPNSVLD